MKELPPEDVLNWLRSDCQHIALNMVNYGDYEDLASSGFWRAVNDYHKYSPNKDIKNRGIRHFLNCRAKLGMIDELRSWDILPRSKRFKEKVIKQTEEHFEQVQGRLPTDVELAEEMGISVENLMDIKLEILASRPASLDQMLVDDFNLYDVLAEDESPWTLFARNELYDWIRKAVGGLKHVYQFVIKHYFFEEENLSTIAKKLGFTESRACQIKQEGLRQLRVMMFKCGLNKELI